MAIFIDGLKELYSKQQTKPTELDKAVVLRYATCNYYTNNILNL
jgi:hypothetical protein